MQKPKVTPGFHTLFPSNPQQKNTSIIQAGLERTGLFCIEAGMEGVEFQIFKACLIDW